VGGFHGVGCVCVGAVVEVGTGDDVTINVAVGVEKSGVRVAVLVGVEKSGVRVTVLVGVEKTITLVAVGVSIGTLGTQST
jgi:hypothetical protein